MLFDIMGKEISRSSMQVYQFFQAIIIMSLNDYNKAYAKMDWNSLYDNKRWVMIMNAFMIAIGITLRCEDCPMVR